MPTIESIAHPLFAVADEDTFFSSAGLSSAFEEPHQFFFCVVVTTGIETEGLGMTEYEL